ncbi:MAG: DUF1835 domain-containing protein [Thalassobaculaceae bacterium]
MATASKPDHDIDTLHVRCGSDIRSALTKAGFIGRFLEVSDPICRGPVPRDVPLLDIRSRFLSAAYVMPQEEVDIRLVREQEGIEQARRVDRVVLWFEHDSYDQLILARLLAAFETGPLPSRLEAVIVNHVPGIDRFIGLGMLSPTTLRDLWDTRRPITRADLTQGKRVWDALREPDPTLLHQVQARGCRAIPVMKPALRRHLQELPWTDNGLSLTQRLVLAAVADGMDTGGAVFRHLHDVSEPLPFLGDLMLWANLADLVNAKRPALAVADRSVPWPKRPIVLTDTGRSLLADETDWQDCGARPRWVGGVEIAADAPDWRWSPCDDRPVRAG